MEKWRMDNRKRVVSRSGCEQPSAPESVSRAEGCSQPDRLFISRK
ncbi:hypothetical protein [Runella sp.]